MGAPAYFFLKEVTSRKLDHRQLKFSAGYME